MRIQALVRKYCYLVTQLIELKAFDYESREREDILSETMNALKNHLFSIHKDALISLG